MLEAVKVKREADRETLIQVARTSLRTKVHRDLADLLTEVSNTVFKGNWERGNKPSMILQVFCELLQLIPLKNSDAVFSFSVFPSLILSSPFSTHFLYTPAFPSSPQIILIEYQFVQAEYFPNKVACTCLSVRMVCVSLHPYHMGGTFQATARVQDSDFFQRAGREMVLTRILSMIKT